MATVPLMPTQAATLNNGNNRWTNLAAFLADTGAASCNNEAKNQTFDTLYTNAYAPAVLFESAVPPVVTGFRVVINRRRGTGRGDNITDNQVQLRLGGAAVGINRASGANWPTALQAASYGSGSGDLWGLSQAQANSVFVQSGAFGRRLDNGFGVLIRPQGRNSGFIRSVTLEVFFTVNATRLRIAGTWVPATVRVRRNGAWALGNNYVRIGGRWVITFAP